MLGPCHEGTQWVCYAVREILLAWFGSKREASLQINTKVITFVLRCLWIESIYAVAFTGIRSQLNTHGRIWTDVLSNTIVRTTNENALLKNGHPTTAPSVCLALILSPRNSTGWDGTPFFYQKIFHPSKFPSNNFNPPTTIILQNPDSIWSL